VNIKATKAPVREHWMGGEATASLHHTPVDEVDVYVTIPGLYPVGEDKYRLSGVQWARIDEGALARSVGYGDRPMPSELADEIITLVRRRQLVEILADRIQVKG